MDPTRFDRFTQALAERRSRRAAVAGLLALVTGGLLGATTNPSVEARPRQHRRPLPPAAVPRRPRPFPGGGCTPTCAGNNCGDNGCGGSCGSCVSGQICQAGRCHGGGGRDCQPTCGGATPDCCGTTCVDTTTDNDNCGACGFLCPPGFRCQGVEGACSRIAVPMSRRAVAANVRTWPPIPPIAASVATSVRPTAPAASGGLLHAQWPALSGQLPAGQGCLDCCGGICADDGTCGSTALPCFADGHACPATCVPGAICFRCCSLTASPTAPAARRRRRPASRTAPRVRPGAPPAAPARAAAAAAAARVAPAAGPAAASPTAASARRRPTAAAASLHRRPLPPAPSGALSGWRVRRTRSAPHRAAAERLREDGAQRQGPEAAISTGAVSQTNVFATARPQRTARERAWHD